MEVTLGGERLGSGKKNKVYMREYERSTHDLSGNWKSTLSPGTLVPFMNLVALPGDTFDIGLSVDIMTQPTIGPLFGSFKVQLDVFLVPMRLYQGDLHMNMLDIGMKMNTIMLPQIEVKGNSPKAEETDNWNNTQINPSSLLGYLGMRGIGHWNPEIPVEDQGQMLRYFNALGVLGYCDIFKQYYANKQEEQAYQIHTSVQGYGEPVEVAQSTLQDVYVGGSTNRYLIIPGEETPLGPVTQGGTDTYLKVEFVDLFEQFNPNDLRIYCESTAVTVYNGLDLFEEWHYSRDTKTAFGRKPTRIILDGPIRYRWIGYDTDGAGPQTIDTEPYLVPFDLKEIDNMRVNLLKAAGDTSAYTIVEGMPAPYGLMLEHFEDTEEKRYYSIQYPQEGLIVKTYQSDILNNWINTEWIDGDNGISAVTAVSTVGDSFTIDELNLSKKVYDMLNRIAISGGTYDDWLDAVYTHDRARSAENPIYMGGMIQELGFQEVISNSQTAEQPLGTLAGRGRMIEGKKGGHVIVRVDEPSYIMGIISLTPRVDYSQGNRWDVNLKTMDDLHKPQLDEIGFQDLVTDQMAAWDTRMEEDYSLTFRSAGKQPAWLWYMTDIDETYGNFAEQNDIMWMTLNRRYEVGVKYGPPFWLGIKDITTYIDPAKYNYIFAETRRDAMNFWVKVRKDITARRKMSAKVIPNL